MAEIYLADAEKSDELLVIKALKPTFYRCEKERALFINEAELLIKLDHPNIVKAIELIQEEERLFLVMEYIVGKPLEQFISKELPASLRSRLAVSAGIFVCEALSYAWNCRDDRHQPLRLVHKDISPQNLIISAAGSLKIIDFGLAETSMRENDDHDRLIGTIHYMSPEQLEGCKLHQTSDIYSLARVLMEIVRGEKWRPQHPDHDVFLGIKNYAITKELRNVLEIALAKEPQERFSDCQKMLDKLKKIEHRFNIDKENIFKECLRQTSKLYQPKKARWAPLLEYLAQLSSLSSALVLMMFVMFCIVVELFKSQLSVIGTAHNSSVHREEVALNEEVPMGKLILKVHPSAELFIGDQFYGVTPIPELSLPAGEYVLQLRSPDHSTIALRRLRIYADKETKLQHTF